MTEDRISHQNISGVSAQNYSQVFAGSAQNVYFANNRSSDDAEPSRKAVECRNALFLTDPRIDRESLITAKGTRVSGTCEWIKNDAIYRAWLTCGGNDDCENYNSSRLLWISGGPGKGKTMLSIFLTEELEKHIAHTKDSGLLFFFCSAQDEKRNTATAVLRGLLHQIIAKRPQLIKHALPYFEPHERVPQTLLSLESLWIIFSSMVSDIEFSTMFCVLDGLDECEESTRRALVSRLAGLLKQSVPSNKSLLRLAIISRDIIGLQDCPRLQLDPDNDDNVISDIGQFVSVRVKELAHIKGFKDDPRKSIYVQRELLGRAQGTFLWVGFAMHELLQKHTWTDVLSSLKGLPSGLPAIYSRMILGIPDKHREMSRLILCWVALAVRPLQLEELAAATYIDCSSSPIITKKQAILDAMSHCGPLLQVQEDRISFIHQSARDYLLREKQDNNKILEEFRIEPTKAHLDLLRTCITCMNQSGLQNSVDALDKEARSQESSLLDYAALHWPEHAKSCSARDIAESNALKRLFHEKSIVRRNWWIAYKKRRFPLLLPRTLPLFHMQCYLGLAPLVEQSVALEKWKPRFLKRIYKKDVDGNTALLPAVKGRNRDVVRILIDNGAKVNARNRLGLTPLFSAVETGDTEILQLLLDNSADVNAKYFGETALHVTAGIGNETIVRLLLDNGADMEAENNHRETALHSAAYYRSEAVVQLLLDRGVNVNAKTRNGTTALHNAAIAGVVAVVRLLLGNGAKMNVEDEMTGTVLHSAVLSGSEAVVQLLLDRGADLNKKNKNGETVLHVAIRFGREFGTTAVEIVRLLLHKGIDMNAEDYKGRTALQLATELGDETMVQLLKQKARELEGGKIDSDSS